MRRRSVVRTASLPAITTAQRLIRKALLNEKLLLPDGKDEFATAVFAGESLIFQHSYPRLIQTGLRATKLGQFLHETRCCNCSAIAFVAAVSLGALLSLRSILSRENAETDRRSGGELHVHDSSGALAGHVIEVCGLAADNDPQRNQRVEAIGLDQFLARQRQLEAARNFKNADVLVGDVAIAQSPLRAIKKQIGEIGIKARQDDREVPFRAVGYGGLRRRLRLHEAATSSKI